MVFAGFHLAAATGCSELPEIRYETDRLQIGAGFDEPICEGTLAALDDHITGVERALGRPKNRDPIVVYWLDDVSEYCGEDRGGCFFPGTRVLFSTGASITHELVHAVLDSTAHTYFVEEGMAEIYSGVDVFHEPQRDGVSLASRLSLSRSAYRGGKLDYAAAAHFMRYVHAARGDVGMRELAEVIADGGSTAAITRRVESVLGADIDTIEHAYYATAPRYFRGFSAAAVDSSKALWQGQRVHLECDDDATRGPLRSGGGGLYQVRSFEAQRGGDAHFSVDGDAGGWVTLFDPTARRGIVTNWAMPNGDVDPRAVTLRTGEQTTVTLDVGTYLLVYGSDHDDADVEATLRMAPPVPVGGESAPEPAPEADR